ncbi:Cytochrome c oxidase assembly protein cox19 [Ceratocystis pirilliformis]|uniref:Cytochrome c oxidase assembly protein cox19 n=1 Tax=Ceratocystis pirilliformis TaxID=259994 RepID=A0ABR3YML1_9PEZI
MTKYLGCLKNVRGVNDEACRELAKGYLTCRMDNNLMARDDFKNLGFKGGESKTMSCPIPVATAAAEATTATPSNHANVAGGQGSSK